MDRHLGRHHMQTPASHDAIPPHRPVVVELETDVVPPSANERLVLRGDAVAADRGLERLGPQRVAELRRRLETGMYGSPEVLTALAIRLLESGDL